MTKKVLIVDDNPDILEALELTFDSVGYQTKAVIRAEEAYKAASDFTPDIIVLDVLLSGKDGRVICKNLKVCESTKHIPILMISAQPDVARSTIASGASDFLAKPFDINDLIQKVEVLA